MGNPLERYSISSTSPKDLFMNGEFVMRSFLCVQPSSIGVSLGQIKESYVLLGGHCLFDSTYA